VETENVRYVYHALEARARAPLRTLSARQQPAARCGGRPVSQP
jgi:hypothetical protein